MLKRQNGDFMAEIKTHPATPEYRTGWDRIFGCKPVADAERQFAGFDSVSVSLPIKPCAGGGYEIDESRLND